MKTTPLCLALAVLLSAAAAQAQTAGTWMLRGGVMNITPDVDSGNLSASSLPNTQIDSNGSTRPSGGITYMLDDHWALDVPIAVPFKHTLTGAGSIAGAGKIGETKALPITLLGQYRFGEAHAQFRPFVGAGLTYAKFFKERSTATLTAITGGNASTPTTLSLESKLGLTLQVGGTLALNERWFVEGMVAKTFVKTTGTLSTGQTIKVTLDPLTLSLGVGYRF
ncbi:outer membrane protein [Rhodoferax ferrireducens]|uniref:Outer membrane protein n=1 Tax=Rhodoferax ferrireducens TaxID=192843 RepID=A0ABU2CB02_9BURK|nr:OmpW family outer membrane protein [Rhodoferax ferrireducens]MDR7378496.1 outer membrane protein [Rhodoferax ferrireducens]